MVKTKDGNKLISGDSILIKLKQIEDSVIKARGNEEQKKWSEKTPSEEEQNSPGLNYILELQKEHRAKEKRRVLIQIGIGMALFIVLIIGLRRRTKK